MMGLVFGHNMEYYSHLKASKIQFAAFTATPELE